MKKVILAWVLLFPGILAAQDRYEVVLKLKSIERPVKAYLIKSYGWSDQQILDSAISASGKFIFRGILSEPEKVSIVIDGKQKTLYLHPGKIVVSTKEDIGKAVVRRSSYNDEYARYLKSLEPAQRSLDSIELKYKALPVEQRKDAAIITAAIESAKKAGKALDSLAILYYKRYPESFLSKAYERSKILPPDNMPAVGTQAPEFSQPDIHGNPVSLSSFKGKYVLVDFWASWCGPCRAENPTAVKAYNQFKDRNFTVLGVSLDQPSAKDAWLTAIEKDGLPWQQVSDLKGWENEAAKKYHIRAIPMNFLIDPEGKIIAKNLRGENLTKVLSEIIK